jgi:hypothetical protein
MILQIALNICRFDDEKIEARLIRFIVDFVAAFESFDEGEVNL